MTQAHPRGICFGVTTKGMSPSVYDTVASSGAGAKCILCELPDVYTPGLGVYVVLVTDHPTAEVSATFLRETINRPIITERYL